MSRCTLIQELVIPGINIAEGIHRVADNADLYLCLLGQFLDKADCADRVAAALADGNRAHAREIAHAIKGIAANMAAGPLAAAAAALDKVLAGDGCAEPVLTEFREALNTTMAGIRAALVPAPLSASGGDGDLGEKLNELARLLGDSDADATTVFREIRGALTGRIHGTALDQLEGMVNTFSFAEALDTLRSIRRQIEGSPA